MESAVKCPLQSRVISVQENTKVTNGEGKKKAAEMRSVLGMRTHAWGIWQVARTHPFLPEVAIK